MEYKDRGVGLTVFGILTVGLGVLCALLVVLLLGMTLMGGMIMAHAAQNGSGAPPPPPPTLATLVPAVLVYGILAVALTWLGIGSILARRWARALLLIFSWSWLVVGVTAIIAMAFLLPSMLANRGASQPSTSALPALVLQASVMAVLFVFYGIILVALPAAWTFFYQSRHVKATCEARYPEPSWTDACPLPVLAVVLWLAYSALTMMSMPFTGMGTLPFFGTFLTGLPGGIACVLLAAVYVVAAWRLYRLDMLGWWLVVGVFALFLVSGLVTFSRHDFMDMYRAMNLPADQLAQMEKMQFLKGNGVLWLMAACFIPMFGYLFFIQRYLRPRPAA